jgi:hypothetical protein
MALPKPEWIDPHRPITVEIAKLVNPHRALVAANINLFRRKERFTAVMATAAWTT